MKYIVFPLVAIMFMSIRTTKERQLGWPPSVFERVFGAAIGATAVSFMFWADNNVPVLFDVPAYIKSFF